MASKAADETKKDDGKKEPIVIKKYANRRLYNTATSSYVTLDYLSKMVQDGDDFVVYDAKSGDDITRSVLAQIIFEQESKGENLLPISFLRQLIQFYGDTLQSALPRYLEFSMDRFSRDQEKMRDYLVDALNGNASFNPFEEMARQNVAMFERMFQMFSPFAASQEGEEGQEETPGAGQEDDAGSENTISELRSQLDALQEKLDRLAEK